MSYIYLIPHESGRLELGCKRKIDDDLDHSNRTYCPFHNSKDKDLWVNLVDGGYHCKSSACGAKGVAVDEDGYSDILKKDNEYHQKLHQNNKDVNIEWSGPDDDEWFNDEPQDTPESPVEQTDWNDVVREHVYTNVNGDNLKRVIYYGIKDGSGKRIGKRPIQQRWENNQWKSGLTYDDGSKVPLTPYRLPNLLKQDKNIIFIVEGEKDVETLHNLGIMCVTTYGSSNITKLDEANINYFRKKNIYLMPDNDKSGYKFAKLLGKLLYQVSNGLKIVFIPDIKTGEDISDWVEKTNASKQDIGLMIKANCKFYESCSEELSKYESELDTLLDFESMMGKHKHFPIDSMPKVIRKYAKIKSERNNSHIEYHALAALAGLTSMMHNSFKLNFDGEWFPYPSYVCAIVGSSGENKTHPIKNAIARITKYNEAEHDRYEQEMKDYLKYKDRKRKDKKDDDMDCVKEKPERKPYISNKFTLEGLREALRDNPKGLLLNPDELSGMFKGFDQHKGGKGNDMETILELLDGYSHSNDLARENIALKNPRLSLISTIQRKVIQKSFKEKTKDLGFAFRFMFADPIITKRYMLKPLNTTEIENSKRASDKLNELYDTLFDLQSELNEPEILNWVSDDVYECLRSFVNDELAYLSDYLDDEDDTIAGINAKIITYTAKLCISFQVIKFYSGESDTKNIEMDTLLQVIELMKYHLYHNKRLLATTGSKATDTIYTFFLKYINKYKVKDGLLNVSNIRTKKLVGYKKTDEIATKVNNLVESCKALWIEKDKTFKLL